AVDGAQSIAIDRCDIATPPREELDRGVERALPKPRKKTHGDALRRVVDDELRALCAALERRHPHLVLTRRHTTVHVQPHRRVPRPRDRPQILQRQHIHRIDSQRTDRNPRRRRIRRRHRVISRAQRPRRTVEPLRHHATTTVTRPARHEPPQTRRRDRRPRRNRRRIETNQPRPHLIPRTPTHTKNRSSRPRSRRPNRRIPTTTPHVVHTHITIIRTG